MTGVPADASTTTSYTLYGVDARGRVINTTTAAVTWTGNYPIGKLDEANDMSTPSGYPGAPPPTLPPIATKTAKTFDLEGAFAQYKGTPPQSHAVAVGITSLKWVDTRYTSCALPTGTIAVRHLPVASFIPPPA